MADEYTPTTEQVVNAVSSDCDWIDPPGFERWLAAHDRETAARAWDEGERHESHTLTTFGQFCPHGTRCNPYREGEAAVADRPRIHRKATPNRHTPHYPWEVWIGPRWHSSHPTHASAITSATYWARVLARASSGTVWTTPDSGTQDDYSLATH